MSELDKKSENALKVAFFTSHMPDMSQEDIRLAINIKSQSEVSRLLSYAKEQGWIEWRMNWPISYQQASQIIDELTKLGADDRFNLEKKIRILAKDRNVTPPRQIHIVHSGHPHVAEEGDEAQAVRRAAFSKNAAEYVRGHLTKTSSCAVAWGRTVAGVVDEMGSVESRSNITFLPISGEPLNNENRGFSPSIAAQRLSEAFGSSPENRLSLNGVPARIPRELSEEADTIRRFVNKSDHYRRIFGNEEGQEPLMDKVEMILTGVGDISTSSNDPWFLETQAMEMRTDLHEVTAGNIAGVWIPKDPNNPKHKEEVDGINSRWLGIQERHFSACAKRADRDERPGVFLLAIEPAKAAIVERAIGLVNHLVISQELARALLVQLNS